MTIEEMQSLQEIGCLKQGLDARLIDEAEYRATGLHYSDLSSIASNDLDKLNPATKDQVRQAMDENPAIIMGNAFEHYLEFGKLPRGMKAVIEQPSMHDYMQQVLDHIMRNAFQIPTTDELIRFARTKGLWKSYSQEQLAKRLAPFNDPTSGIYKYILQEQSIQMLSYPTTRITKVDEFRIIKASDAVNAQYFSEDKDLDIFWQVPLVGLVNGLPFAIKIDRLVVDRKNKKLKIQDIKYTQRKALDWDRYFWWYGYWIQQYVYEWVVYYCLTDGWELLETEFIVGSAEQPELPARWVANRSEVMHVGDIGYNSNGKRIKSLAQLVEAFKWHHENDTWDYPFDYYMNNRKLQIRAL